MEEQELHQVTDEVAKENGLGEPEPPAEDLPGEDQPAEPQPGADDPMPAVDEPVQSPEAEPENHGS